MARAPATPGGAVAPGDPAAKSSANGDAKPTTAETRPKIELTLPSDRDIDRVMGLVARAWQRLIEMANRMQRDVSGRI